MRGRGLKFIALLDEVGELPSPSLRGRGLKCTVKKTGTVKDESPSLRGRGLKSLTRSRPSASQQVALFARAWIEISELKNA